MTLDLDKYTINKPFIIQQYKESQDKNISLILSIAACSSMCPLVALAFYLASDLGFIPEITDVITKLIKFYDYQEITGQPDNSPFRESIGKQI